MDIEFYSLSKPFGSDAVAVPAEIAFDDETRSVNAAPRLVFQSRSPSTKNRGLRLLPSKDATGSGSCTCQKPYAYGTDVPATKLCRIAPSLGSRLREHQSGLQIKKRFVNTQIGVRLPMPSFGKQQWLPTSMIVMGMISQNHRNIVQNAAT
jgi:hypothetical protein